EGASHDGHIATLALLHLVIGTILGDGVGYGACLVGVLVVAPGALLLSHLRCEVEGNYRQGARDRSGSPVDVARILRSRRVVGGPLLRATCLLSVPIALFALCFFAVTPRAPLSLPFWRRAAGAGSGIDLGSAGLLRPGSALAMRVRLPDAHGTPPRLALYLR